MTILPIVEVGDPRRVAVVEVRPGNPRYPYKAPVALTVIVNPSLEPMGEQTVAINEGCLPVPDLRGEVRAQFDRFHRAAFEARAQALVERVGS